ncbi:MAG: tetratricopeptide repeat protein, partial [Bacteroidota bacterium]
RKYYGVGTLVEQQERERRMNLKSILSLTEKKSTDELIKLIKTEFKKGKKSSYDVSEGTINSLGYRLMSQGKDAEALKVFKLNTKLYPKGFNTYDSYGECLLKLGETKKGTKAYKRSLELNPENENASKILAEMDK